MNYTMSNKKLKQTDNIENLNPTTRKRGKTNPIKNYKTAKLNSNTPPTAPTSEHLVEMGVGMLDSEESSSSAASAIALVMSASTDENSSGVTPNLDAPKICHQRISSYHTLDNTIDNTFNSDTSDNTTIATPGRGLIEADCLNISQHCNNNNIAMDAHCDTNNKQNSQQQSGDKVLLPNRKVAILGMGAGNPTSNASTHTTAIAPQSHTTNSNSNSPSAGRSTRSPLAIVSGNNNIRAPRSATHHIQQQLNMNNGINAVATINASHAYNNGAPSLNNYMNMPSTSKQLLLRQKQRQKLQQLQQQEEQHTQVTSRNRTSRLANEQQPSMALYDDFFLFRRQQLQGDISDGKDNFSALSDEIILHIFKWLPKKVLIRCSYVCHRFHRCANDESLWSRLDLGGRHLRAGALEHILTRGVVILRLAQAELKHPVFESDFLQAEPKFESKLQYLDLSMVSVAKPSLKMLLSRCRQLKKLSLEHVPINDEICNEIAKNTNLEALNLAMCIGLEAWSVRKIMESLQNLNSLNISWTNLSVDAVTSVMTNITPNLLRLNMAGCRKTLYDSHVATLAKRCPQLLEIDFSDCSALTGSVINIICNFKMLEYLSLSRCYLIPASAFIELHNLPTLTYLDIFGMLSDVAMASLKKHFPKIGVNKFIHSSVARPTVGSRRTSVWGLRTRD